MTRRLETHRGQSCTPDPVDVVDLGARGSLFVTRPALMHHVEEREDLIASAEELFDVVSSGAVTITVRHRYPLREAADVHRAIEERRTTGSTVLLPFA